MLIIFIPIICNVARIILASWHHFMLNFARIGIKSRSRVIVCIPRPPSGSEARCMSGCDLEYVCRLDQGSRAATAMYGNVLRVPPLAPLVLECFLPSLIPSFLKWPLWRIQEALHLQVESYL